MNNAFITGVAVLSILALGQGVPAPAADRPASGEELFKKHCQVCHPDGGNIINKDKTLTGKALGANGLKTPRDLVKQMRNPGTGMTKFDEQQIPDADAEAIAKYILKAFK